MMIQGIPQADHICSRSSIGVFGSKRQRKEKEGLNDERDGADFKEISE